MHMSFGYILQIHLNVVFSNSRTLLPKPDFFPLKIFLEDI